MAQFDALLLFLDYNQINLFVVWRFELMFRFDLNFYEYPMDLKMSIPLFYYLPQSIIEVS
jgi:hypothetical protein